MQYAHPYVKEVEDKLDGETMARFPCTKNQSMPSLEAISSANAWSQKKETRSTFFIKKTTCSAKFKSGSTFFIKKKTTCTKLLS